MRPLVLLLHKHKGLPRHGALHTLASLHMARNWLVLVRLASYHTGISGLALLWLVQCARLLIRNCSRCSVLRVLQVNAGT